MLFEPLAIGSMTIKNRLVRSGSSESGSLPDGTVKPELKKMYVDLARGGTSLIITGFAYIREDGRSGIEQNAIHYGGLIPQWREITDAVHAADPTCKIAMQIVHGGRQCKPDSVTQTIAPSAVFDPRANIMPREMTGEEIWEMVEAFGQAAWRVKEAGFDAVQLHAAHGYLLSQFISPHTNRRTDEWGGSANKRKRFFIEVYQRVRKAVGDDFPILAKVNCDDFLPGGLTPELSADICKTMSEEGLDGIELSAWMFEADPELTPSRKVDPSPDEEVYFLQQARVVREAVPATTPLGVCGGIRSLAVMEKMLTDEGFDFVSASRPFIAEPDLANRLAQGQERSACNSCNECITVPRIPIVHCPPAREGRLSSPYLSRRV